MNENKSKISRRAVYILATALLAFLAGYILYTAGVIL